MRKLLSLIALFCVMAIGAGVSVSSANAATLTSAVHSLKVGKAGRREGILSSWLFAAATITAATITDGITAAIIAVAGGIMAIATAVAGTRTSAMDHHSEASGSDPGALIF